MRARHICSPQNGITCGKVSFYALEARHLAVAHFIRLFFVYIYIYIYINIHLIIHIKLLVLKLAAK